jgi:hypothetical protein
VRQLEKAGNARTVDMPGPSLTAPAELAADIKRFSELA